MATKKVSTKKIVKGVQVEVKPGVSLSNAHLGNGWTTVKAVKDGKARISVVRYSPVKRAYQTVQINVPVSKLQPTKSTRVRLNNQYDARITAHGNIRVGCQRISAKQVLEVAAAIRKQQRQAAK